MCTASEVKESFAALKQTFKTVLLKEKCSLSTRGTGSNRCVDVMEDTLFTWIYL